MKRDFNLIRTILLAVQQQPAGKHIDDFVLPDEDAATVAEHVELLLERRLIIGSVRGLIGAQRVFIRIERLTDAGHDFVDAAASITVWRKTQDKLKSLGSSVSFEVFLELMKAVSRSQLGL